MPSPILTALHGNTGPLNPRNRRAFNRYQVNTPLRYRPEHAGPGSVWKDGRALNMSARGILIDIPDTFPINATVELMMDWSGLYHGTSAMRLFLVATIVRVDDQGTALRIVRHQFSTQRPEKHLAVVS